MKGKHSIIIGFLLKNEMLTMKLIRCIFINPDAAQRGTGKGEWCDSWFDWV